jgi:hypothetical protein
MRAKSGNWRGVERLGNLRDRQPGPASQIASDNTTTHALDDQHLTSLGSAVGTVARMSPKQARS